MGEYLAPGVFVEEIDSGSKPIEGVAVNNAAFIGYAKSGKFNEPVFIANWGDFCREFGEDDDAVIPALCEELGLPAAHVLQKKRDSKKPLAEFAHEMLVQNYRSLQQTGGAEGKSAGWNEFVRTHKIQLTNSPFLDDAYLAYAVRGYYDNGGGRAYIVRVAREEDLKLYSYTPSTTALSAGVAASAIVGGYSFRALTEGEKGNNITVEVTPVGEDGGDQFTLTVKSGNATEKFGSAREPLTPSTATEAVRRASKLVDLIMEVGVADRPSVGTFNLTGGMNASATVLEKVPLEEEIENVKPEEFEGDESRRSGFRGLSLIEDLNFIMVPDLMSGLYSRKVSKRVVGGDTIVEVGPETLNRELLAERRKQILGVQKLIIDYCERSGDRMCILDPLPDLSAQEVRDVVVNESEFSSDHGQATIYYPWVKVVDQNHRGRNGERYNRLVPPSGHIAGVWAQVAVNRGVHKAPANESLKGVVSLAREVTKGEQEILNPEGINCLRSFPGTGIRVWGARTLATRGNPSWKYVNVRRLFNYIESTINRSLNWAVFEPNDHDLWGRVRRNISAFLFTEWKEGKLFGRTPEEAYYVKCDEETNPREMIDLGRLYVEIGVNPVKPAEFVIIRIGQWSGGGETNEN